MRFELWKSRDGYTLLGLPRFDRWLTMREPDARLMLRIEAATPQEAKLAYERFAYDGNREKRVPLGIPVRDLFIDAYPCGLTAGETIVLLTNYDVRVGEYVDARHAAGTAARVLPGDSEVPEIVWLKVLKCPAGEGKSEGMFHVREEEIHDLLQRG